MKTIILILILIVNTIFLYLYSLGFISITEIFSFNMIAVAGVVGLWMYAVWVTKQGQKNFLANMRLLHSKLQFDQSQTNLQTADKNAIPRSLLFEQEIPHSYIPIPTVPEWSTKLLFTDTSVDEDSYFKTATLGYYVLSRLTNNTHCTSKTYLTRENDLIFNILKQNDTSLTVMEWNDFEDVFRVETQNPREAREILTPNAMLDLHDTLGRLQSPIIRIYFEPTGIYILSRADTMRHSDSGSMQPYMEKNAELINKSVADHITIVKTVNTLLPG